MALNAHNVLQSAWQTDFGTAVATSTIKLQNVSSFALTPNLETRAHDQLRGTLAPTHETSLDSYSSNATFEVADESFEDLNYWLEALFGTDSTPTGAGPYVRDYAAPTTAAVTPRFMTLQYGQANEVWQMQDASISSLTLSGENNSGIKVGGSLIGGKVIAGALQALADRTTTSMPTGCMASVAIETWAGNTFTPIAATAYSWELSVNPNRQYRSHLGACTPTAYNDQKWSGQLKLSLELNDSSDDYLIAMLAAANAIQQHQVRILYTVGATTTLRTVQIDFAGHTMSAPQLFGDRNGVMTYDLVLDGVYNPTMSNWLKLSTTSNIAVLA